MPIFSLRRVVSSSTQVSILHRFTAYCHTQFLGCDLSWSRFFFFMTCVIVRKNGKWCGFGDELCEMYRLTSESSSEALHPDASEARVARVTALLDHVMSFDASRMKRQGRPFFSPAPAQNLQLMTMILNGHISPLGSRRPHPLLADALCINLFSERTPTGLQLALFSQR